MIHDSIKLTQNSFSSKAPSIDESTDQGFYPELSLVIGRKFDSHDDLVKFIALYEDASYTQFARRTTQKIEDKIGCNPRLEFSYIRYACVYGGRKFTSRSKGVRKKSRSQLTDCPAFFRLGLTRDRGKLIIKELNLNHNHEISKENYENLPRQRVFSKRKKEEIAELILDLNVDKKLVHKKLVRETNKPIKMKDLHNIVTQNREKFNIPAPPRKKKIVEQRASTNENSLSSPGERNDVSNALVEHLPTAVGQYGHSVRNDHIVMPSEHNSTKEISDRIHPKLTVTHHVERFDSGGRDVDKLELYGRKVAETLRRMTSDQQEYAMKCIDTILENSVFDGKEEEDMLNSS